MSVINQMLKSLEQNKPKSAEADYPTFVENTRNRIYYKSLFLLLLCGALGYGAYYYYDHAEQVINQQKVPKDLLAGRKNLNDYVTPISSNQSNSDTDSKINYQTEAKAAATAKVAAEATATENNHDTQNPLNPKNTHKVTAQLAPSVQSSKSSKSSKILAQTRLEAKPDATPDAKTNVKSNVKPDVPNKLVKPPVQNSTLKTQAQTKPKAQLKSKKDEALNHQASSVSILPTNQSPNQLAQHKLTQAQKLLASGSFTKAEHLLKEALTIKPDLHKARMVLMSLYYGAQNNTQALAVLNQGMQAYPNQLQYRFMAARVLMNMNQADAAWRLVGQTPSDALKEREFTQFKALLAQQVKAWPAALMHWQSLLTTNPNQPSWLLGAGIAADNINQSTLAMTYYQQVVNQNTLSQASTEFAQQRLKALNALNVSEGINP